MKRTIELVIRGTDKGASGLLGRISGALGGLGQVAATALGVLAGQLMRDVIYGLERLAATTLRTAADFEEAMAILGVVAKRELGASLGELHDVALQVGADTSLLGVTASGAAQAITDLYKAGMKTSDVFGDLQGYLAGTAELGGALRAAVDLAAASELELVAASQLAAVALATFGSGLETAEERSNFVNDALNNFMKTADASVAEVSDLAAAWTNVAQTAATFGFSLGDLNTALALMSTRGIKGAEAGTALKSMLTNMMRSTTATKGAWNELGVSLYDSEGTMRSLPAIMGDLEGALAGLTEEQRNQYIQTLAGTFGMKAMQTLLAEGSAGWDEMATSIAGASTVQDYAAARAATFKGQLEILKGALETVAIGAGEALLPALTLLATMFAAFVSEHGPQLVALFSQLGQWLVANLPTAIATLAAFWTGTLLPAIQVAWAFIQANVLPLLAQLWTWLQTNLPTAIAALSAFWTGTLLPAIQVAWAFIQANVLPLLAELWTWLQTNLPTAIAALSAFWTGTLQPALQVVWAFIQGSVLPLFQQLYAWFVANWPVMQAVVLTAWTVIQSIIQAVVGVLVGQVWPQLKAAIDTLTETMAAAGISWGDVWNAVKGAVGLVAAAIGAILLALVAVVVGVVNGIAAFLQQLMIAWQTLASGVQTTLEGLAAFIGGIMAIIQGIFAGNWALIGEGIYAFVNSFQTIFQGLMQIFRGLWQATFGVVIALVRGFVQGVIAFFTNLYHRLVGGSILTDMVNAIGRLFQQMTNELIQTVRRLVDTIVNWFVTFKTRIVEKARSIVEMVKKAFTQPDWSGIGKGMVDGIAKGVMSKAKELAKKAAQIVKDAIAAAKRAIRGGSPSLVAEQELGRPIGEGVGVGLDRAMRDVQTAFTAQVGGLTGAGTVGISEALRGVQGALRADLGDLVSARGRGGGRTQRPEQEGGGPSLVVQGDLVLQGVQDARGLLEQLQRLMV